VQLRYNFRLYPTPGQAQALAKAFGCARVVFNDALAARQESQSFRTGASNLMFAQVVDQCFKRKMVLVNRNLVRAIFKKVDVNCKNRFSGQSP